MARCSSYEANVLKAKMRNSFFMKDHYPDIVDYHKNEFMSFLDSINTDYLVKRKRKIRQIDSKEKALEYIEEARKSFLECLGDMPKTTEVRARVVKTLNKGSYLIDNVLIESMPGYYLSANFYYPAEIKEKCPGILFLLGHSSNGKGARLYIDFCVEAVLNGFCVLTFDPVGQGERKMYDEKDDPMFASGGVDNVHCSAGQQVILTGDNLSRYMMWDNVKALDYLCSREEVDASRLGVTGNSGGGQMSAFMGAYDPRLKVIAPCCYMTELRQEAYYIGSQDPEQSMPNFMKKGLNKADLITLAAPKPYLIGAGLCDYFPIDGTRDAFIEARKIYRLLDAEDNLNVYIAPKPHGFWCDTRENVLRFMCTHFGVEFLEDNPVDYDNLPEESELLCLDNGDIRSVNTVSLQEMFRKTAEEVYPERKPVDSAEEMENFRKEVRKHVLEALGIDMNCLKSEIISMKEDEIKGNEGLCGYINKTDIAYWSEEYMKVYCTLYTVNGGRQQSKSLTDVEKADGKPASEELGEVFVHVGVIEEDKVKEYLKDYKAVLAIEPRGTGRGAMHPESWFYTPSGYENVESQCNYNAWMLGRSLIGMRVMDIIGGIRVLRQISGFENCQIKLYGREEGALYALCAAVIEDAKDLTLERMLYCYKSIVNNRVYKWSPSVFAPGLLAHFDIDDLLVALMPANIRLIEPLDNMKKPIDSELKTVSFNKVTEALKLFKDTGSLIIE